MLTDRDVLRCAGLMGHRFAIVEQTDNGPRMAGESDDLERAKVIARPMGKKAFPRRVYERVGKEYIPVEWRQ